MRSIFISGMAGSGKTAIALGLALKLRAEGIKVGYFKPLIHQGVWGTKLMMMCGTKEVLNLPHDESVLSLSTLHRSICPG